MSDQKIRNFIECKKRIYFQGTMANLSIANHYWLYMKVNDVYLVPGQSK